MIRGHKRGMSVSLLSFQPVEYDAHTSGQGKSASFWVSQPTSQVGNQFIYGGNVLEGTN